VPEEHERQAAVSLQVEEIRQRQAAGLLPADLDPGHLRLLGFALINYPRMLPQITRMTTGMTPEDERFGARWEALLRDVGSWIEAAAAQQRAGKTPLPLAGEDAAHADSPRPMGEGRVGDG
jgi:hypothetical protein